ncbi:MAG: hypothetical protein DMD60_08715 [Gemmatimonadetes bacterium]|nr:MAG: hypothetical protein DMD60_08715 [Gemmatimonadota bacterium]
MRRTSRKVWRLAAGTITVALFAACSTSPVMSPQNSVLTQPQANAVAEVVATDAASLVGGATLDAATGMPFAVAPMPGEPAMVPSSASCTPTRSPSPPANSDGDPVPDSVRIAFTGCTFSGDGHTATLSGSIDIVDPTPTTTDRAFRTRSNAFTRTVTSTTGTTRSVVENGVRSVVGTPDQVQLTDTMQTDYTYATGATASHVRKWLATFVADQPGSIQMGSPLPSGKWSISGSSTWTSGTNTYSLSVSTSDPLHYNASCTVEPRFDSGKLTAVVTKGTASTTVTIQFTACGQYTVTRS